MHRTWHELLKQIIEDSQEKQRIARQIHVKALTLYRWTSTSARPREENMRQLLKAIPRAHYRPFMELILVDYPHFAHEDIINDGLSKTPPPEVYSQVLRAHANTSQQLYPQAIFDIVLQKLLENLDPDRRGMVARVMRCVTPLSGDKVRSLRQIYGRGNPPWPRDLDQQMIFLGAESLAGASVSHYRRVMVPSRDAPYSAYPVHWLEHEQSVAGYPIARKTRVAGSLVVSSAHPHYFTETHLSLIECYADLAALAFESEEFFETSKIELHLMPPYSQQLAYFHNFSQRASQKFAEARCPIDIHEARERVWREIEEELLKVRLESL